MIESIRQVLTGNRKSIILVWQAHHNIAKWICWKDSEVKEPMPKWKAHQSTRLRLTRGKTLKEEGCINHLLIERFLASNYWKNGSFFICVLRNRCLYRTSVICFNIEKYSYDENIIFMVKSYDDNIFVRLVIKHWERIVFHVRKLMSVVTCYQDPLTVMVSLLLSWNAN